MLKRIQLADFPEQYGGFGDEENCSAVDNTFFMLFDQQSSPVDGHYKVSLLFGEADVNLPNNKFLSMKRRICRKDF